MNSQAYRDSRDLEAGIPFPSSSSSSSASSYISALKKKSVSYLRTHRIKSKSWFSNLLRPHDEIRLITYLFLFTLFFLVIFIMSQFAFTRKGPGFINISESDATSNSVIGTDPDNQPDKTGEDTPTLNFLINHRNNSHTPRIAPTTTYQGTRQHPKLGLSESSERKKKIIEPTVPTDDDDDDGANFPAHDSSWSRRERQAPYKNADLRKELTPVSDRRSSYNTPAYTASLQRQNSHRNLPIVDDLDNQQRIMPGAHSLTTNASQETRVYTRKHVASNVDLSEHLVKAPETPPSQFPPIRSVPQDFPKPTPLPQDKVTPEVQQVIEAMKWSWKGYEDYAWGKDTLKPNSKGFSTWFDLGLTIIDALDTLWLMGLDEQYVHARNFIAYDLSFEKDIFVNTFETTIRCLGGLLSAYALTMDHIYLRQATDLGNRLLPAFRSSPTGIPFSDVNIKTGAVRSPGWSPDSSTSEATTVQMEFQYLSYLTRDPKYAKAVDVALCAVLRILPKDGLVPIYINPQRALFDSNIITLGARGDSYYEYLLKQWILTSKKDDIFKDTYVNAVKSIQSDLIRETKGGLTFVGELLNHQFSPKMDHLVCFFPATLALGAYHEVNGLPYQNSSHFRLAEKLTYTCNQMYERTNMGLAGEISHFNLDSATNDLFIKDADSHNLLRPEAIEAFYYMSRFTKDPRYKQWGKTIMDNFDKFAKIESGGYSTIRSVLRNRPFHNDNQETFWLGETLKYLFLLQFDDEKLLPFDEWVFNTEAHPFPIFERRPGMEWKCISL